MISNIIDDIEKARRERGMRRRKYKLIEKKRGKTIRLIHANLLNPRIQPGWMLVKIIPTLVK